MSGVFGIRRDGDHWRAFRDAGDLPGKYAGREPARWGGWVDEAGARQINEVEGRLITMEDVRAAIRERLP